MFESHVSKILTGWTLTIFTGLGLFYLSRKATTKHRQEQMLARRRAQRAIKDIENSAQRI